jgi:hypothetical protein
VNHPIHIAALVVLLLCALPFVVALTPTSGQRWAQLKNDARRAKYSRPDVIARVFLKRMKGRKS